MKIEKIHEYLELSRSCQHDFFYPLILQEYIYALAHDHGLQKKKILDNADYEKKYSLRIVKRLITHLSQQDYFIFSTNDLNDFFKDKKNLYFQIVAEGFTVMVEIPFSLRLLLSPEGKGIVVNSHNLRSIHSIFPFFEDKFSHLNYILKILIPYPIHLEISVQTLRYWMKDVSSLHLLRFLLYKYRNCNRKSFLFRKESISLFSKRNQRLFLFLYNSYVCEYESVIIFLHNQSSHLRSTFYGALLERIYFYGKMEHLVKGFPKKFHTMLWFFQDPLMHYVRYQDKSIMASKGTSLLMNKWRYYLINLWQFYFSVWSQPRRIYIDQLFKFSFNFMGFLSSLRLNPSMVRSQMLENSFLIDNPRQNFATLVPTISLIGSLTKSKFCNGLRHPISKSAWADLSDSDIIDRFGRICRSLSHYYSGSSRRSSLYSIQYILRVSCAKTLSRKHKSTVRAFLKRLGSDFLEEFFTEEEKVLSFIVPRDSYISHKLYGVRIWYLDIFCIYDLFTHE
uniref:Maturase K n=1 Tax=Aldrovanda vesiculosa TaxID=173386 RepID=A0A1Z2RQZ1_9CARY|nr:intron maturase K [Aldrovanda vesiculosa]ASA46300.1 intron maturase K [Aldrovanda vesiculosa]QBC71183.1 maturase K [Aldrovanda vesiculosa]